MVMFCQHCGGCVGPCGMGMGPGKTPRTSKISLECCCCGAQTVLEVFDGDALFDKCMDPTVFIQMKIVENRIRFVPDSSPEYAEARKPHKCRKAERGEYPCITSRKDLASRGKKEREESSYGKTRTGMW